MHVKTPGVLGKLEDRSKEMVFVGYERGTKGYRCFNPVRERNTKERKNRKIGLMSCVHACDREIYRERREREREKVGFSPIGEREEDGL